MARRRPPPARQIPHWVRLPPAEQPRHKRRRDGLLPFLSAYNSKVNRRRQRLALNLFRSKYKEHIIQEPLPKDWKGFDVDFSEGLKVLYTVEFQKRGLPHAHILIWLKRQDVEMAVNPLSDLNPSSRHWTVQVYVSRLWQHRGSTDDGPIKHTDMVLLDTQGNHMYAEISVGCVDQFMDRLREGKVYELKRFLVNPKKYGYRPVEGQFIIRFGKYTSVVEINDNLMDYPLCTYMLTPIDDLPRPSDRPETFTDVLGIITGVSPATEYHSAYRATPSTKRIIYLSDMNGFKISLVLWGERAITFDGDGVLESAAKGPVVAIFVGTLVKPYEGRNGLSGAAPCRWYINEDLPEINELHARLKNRIPAVENISLPGQSAAEISAQVDLETKTVSELLGLNIWDHDKTKFFCTVVITKLSPSQRWWFTSCRTCHKSAIPYGTGYKCSDPGCIGTGAMPRYRICYLGSDGSGEVELVFFDRVGTEITGKPLMSLLKIGLSPATPLNEVIEVARAAQSTPRELAAVVSRKFRFVVSVTTKSFEPGAGDPSYQVHRIDTEYGKQSHSSALRRNTGLALASSSKSAEGGLNSSGKALADLASVDQPTSLDTAAEFSDAPLSSCAGASQVGSDVVLPLTPPSVVKPPGISNKDASGSSVTRTLFKESPPRGVSGNAGLVFIETPSDPLTLSTTSTTEDPEETPPAATTVTTDKRRRQQSAKSLADTQSKKKKN